MKQKSPPSHQPSEIETELLALTGSVANYDALLESFGEQLRAISKTGHRIIMKGNKVIGVTLPEKKRLRSKRSQLD